MADTMQFDLVSPERSLASFSVTEVQIPGADGDMTAMADHAPTITSLRPGILRTIGPDGTKEYVVTGGFAEISSAGTSVLAEQAIAREDVTQDDIDAMVASAAEAKSKASPDAMDAAVKLMADMVAMGDEIGLSAKQPNL
ncbi:F0F1 ATP synthase subunit epsilon [Nereida sp. MMG025]|uniref:F0F1 ATP synthase subunit epsilon n=1 Tax=Nereida sp. MMG025 TaxID=2909981 RepID=UPI001F1ED4F0|nr:F0F1 ATP synthase subunit epsilon [Nereida sp. MMG025]MCF6444108.1 F0F1 ATP synthase subunit epsilon [Nereida sp. MMG025]